MEFIDMMSLAPDKETASMSLTDRVIRLPSGENLNDLLDKTAEYLKEITNSDGYIIYSYDAVLQELFICPINSTDTECTRVRRRWRIETSDTIAVYVLKNKTPMLVDATTSMDLNFPYLQAISDLCPRFIMSLPLLNFDMRCYGVVEYYKNHEQYNETEVAMCMFLLKNCAEAFKQNENAMYYFIYNSIQFNLQEKMEKFTFNDIEGGSYKFLYRLVKTARDVTEASNSNLYLVKERKMRKVVSTDDGFIFKPHEENPDGVGPIIRSVASKTFYAMLMTHRMHAILKVYNKRSQPRFALIDELVLESVGKMGSTWALIESMSGYLKKQESLNENLRLLIAMQFKHSAESGTRVSVPAGSSMDLLNSWDYEISFRTDVKKLVSDVVLMFMDIMGSLPLSQRNLLDFVVMIEHCTHKRGEHDFVSSVRCVQALFRMLKSCKLIGNEIEMFSMMVAALCHNIVVHNNKTAVSSIFGRYNLYAQELIRFEIAQIIIEETKLFGDCNENMRAMLLRMIKDYIVGMNLNSFKLNTAEFGKTASIDNMETITIKIFKIKRIRRLVQAILPPMANVLAQFRSKPFRSDFPQFNLFEQLKKDNLNCIDIILSIR